METLIIVLKIMGLAWLISGFDPFQWLLELLTAKWNNLAVNSIVLLLSCPKCLALWTGLILSGSIWIAIGASFSMSIYERTIGKWLKKVTFDPPSNWED